MITKELKDYTFDWSDEKKSLAIIERSNQDNTSVGMVMDKVRMLSLMRFMIRVMQHLSVHKHAKISK